MGLLDFIMRLFGIYRINGWHGKKYFMTAKKLYERVVEDSKSDFNWIAPATELVRICKEPDFPKEYAKEIKICILKCFANLEKKKEYPSNQLSTDNDAVYYCFNSMATLEDEDVISARKRYFSAILDGIIKYDHEAGSVRLPIHCGPKYREVCKKWKEAMIKDYFDDKSLNFDRIRRLLEIEFYNTIKVAENQGVLAEEDEERWSDFIHNNDIAVIGEQGVPTTDLDREER